MLKKYYKFFKDNLLIKDVILIILGVISLIIWLSGTVFGASEEIGWSDSPRGITDADFKEIISSYTNYDVSSEDFNTYVCTTHSNYTYNTILSNYLLNDNFNKAFYEVENGVAFMCSDADFKFYYTNGYNSKYYSLSNMTWVFNFEDKIFYYGNSSSYPDTYLSGTSTSTLGYELGYNLSSSGVAESEFTTSAFQQQLMYKTFFLVLGKVYSSSSVLLNDTISYKVTSNEYDGIVYTGDINFSTEFESWITEDLSDSFISSGDTFTYYLEAYPYTEDSFSLSSDYMVKISDVVFTGNSIYQPTISNVQLAMETIDGYMNYGYTITLCLNNNPSNYLLCSDLFIVDAKPIAMIPYFKMKYDYIYYAEYVDSSSNDSSDDTIVTNPSGDSTDLGGGISGIWQAIVDLPKTILDGLVSLFVPDSDYFYNEDLENPRFVAKNVSFL